VSKYAQVEVNNVSNVPSDYMDPPRWIQLTGEVNRVLARPEVAGVIISHGTDTLEETAYWIDLTVNLSFSSELSAMLPSPILTDRAIY
jgi:L-asparaginase